MAEDPNAPTVPEGRELGRNRLDLARALSVAPEARYRAIRMLGEGGMGEVTLVADEVIGREVALKRLKPGSADGGDRERFAHEAILQGRLEHPSIVPVYDFARDAEGALFFTMRRVRGRPLLEVIRGREQIRLLHAFRQICLAAQFAHEHGVVHCDIKPANIMLGDYGEVYLLDWGIARSADDAPRSENTVSGTLGYMSPEQAHGSRTIDARSDIYALGAILFEILVGQPLHDPAPPADMLASIEHGVDARPSVRAPAANVPPELEAICVRATALEPGDRYDSARELAGAVERYLEGDRDLELRKRIAGEQATRAGELVARAAESSDVRSEALATLGRALALDPNNADALATLVSLLTAPPQELPPDAIDEIRATERGLDRVRARAGIAALFAWAFGTAIACGLAGIRDATAFALTVAVITVAAILGVVRYIWPREDGFMPTYQIFAISAAIAGMGIWFHPSLLTPTIGFVFTMAATLSVDQRRRYVPLIAGSIALALPVVLEWSGTLAPSLVNRGDLLCMVPRMADLPDTAAARQIPLATTLICFVMGGLFAVRFRTALADMQRRNAINAWQLRQLVPKAAGAAARLKSGPVAIP